VRSTHPQAICASATSSLHIDCATPFHVLCALAPAGVGVGAMAEDAPADAQEAWPSRLPQIDAPTADAPAAPAGIKKLATMVSGCRDDVDGESAKKQLVQSYVEANNDNILGVLCQLHGHKVIVLSPGKLLKALTWKKGGATGTEDLVKESSHPGLFLANVLANASPSSMEALYKSYVVSNPNLDQIALLHYVNTKGFLEYGADGVLRDVSWLPPQTDEATAANWRSLWGRHIPEGTPWYATVRDQRGNKSKIAFLGSALDDGTPLAQPSGTTRAQARKVRTHPSVCPSQMRQRHTPLNDLIRFPSLPCRFLSLPCTALMLKQWKVPSPNMCICVDGGEKHAPVDSAVCRSRARTSHHPKLTHSSFSPMCAPPNLPMDQALCIPASATRSIEWQTSLNFMNGWQRASRKIRRLAKAAPQDFRRQRQACRTWRAHQRRR
jgi:hypothetical protein